MSVQDLAALDRDMMQPLSRVIQEAFSDGISNTLKIYCVDKSQATYLQNLSSVVGDNIYGIRLFVSRTAGVSTKATRAIRAEADLQAGVSSSLLEAGLFTAKVSAGTATVTNIRALTGHISIGNTLIVSGDVCAVNAHVQTRGNESITGAHCGVFIKNEAVGGNGITLKQAIYITEAYLGGGEKGYGILIDASTATLDISDTTIVTLMKFKGADGTVKSLTFADGQSALAVS